MDGETHRTQEETTMKLEKLETILNAFSFKIYQGQTAGQAMQELSKEFGLPYSEIENSVFENGSLFPKQEV